MIFRVHWHRIDIFRLWNALNSCLKALQNNHLSPSSSVGTFFRNLRPISISMICAVGTEHFLLQIFMSIQDAFKNFAKLLANYPVICERAHFIFVPGPQDRHSPKIYPRLVSYHTSTVMRIDECFRASLPPAIGDLLKKRLRHFHLASNPVRLQYCTQEIVIFREDLLQKLCRYCIKLPNDNLPMHVNACFHFKWMRTNDTLCLVMSNIGVSSASFTFTSLYDTNLLGIWSCSSSLSFTRFDCYLR